MSTYSNELVIDAAKYSDEVFQFCAVVFLPRALSSYLVELYALWQVYSSRHAAADLVLATITVKVNERCPIDFGFVGNRWPG